MSPQILKCKLCDWQTKAWTTDKKGRRKSGYPRLREHVYIEHPEMFEELEEFQEGDEQCH